MSTEMDNCFFKFKDYPILKKLWEYSQWLEKKSRNRAFKEPTNISISCLFLYKKLELDIYYKLLNIHLCSFKYFSSFLSYIKIGKII